MGTYGISAEEIKDDFRKFLMDQEGDVSAETIAGAWNQISKEEGWEDTLEASAPWLD